jgi:hypothetical protein
VAGTDEPEHFPLPPCRLSRFRKVDLAFQPRKHPQMSDRGTQWLLEIGRFGRLQDVALETVVVGLGDVVFPGCPGQDARDRGQANLPDVFGKR